VYVAGQLLARLARVGLDAPREQPRERRQRLLEERRRVEQYGVLVQQKTSPTSGSGTSGAPTTAAAACSARSSLRPP
jgi:hypothetical protein